MRILSRMSDLKTPEVRDPRWEHWALPLLGMLSEPRDWEYLRAWYRENHYGGDKFRHCLAWLEEKGLAGSRVRETRTVWYRTAYGAELAKKEPRCHAFGHRSPSVPLADLSLDGGFEPVPEEGGVIEEQAARNLRDDLALLRRDGVLGEETLLVDGRLYERAHESLLESGVLGVAQEDLSEPELPVAVEETHGGLEGPPEVQEVEQQVDLGLRKAAS